MSCPSLDDPLLSRAYPSEADFFLLLHVDLSAVIRFHPALLSLSSPASLDAFVFSHLVLLLQAKLPSGKLQAHLRGLHNLCVYCTHILNLYFPQEGGKEQMERMNGLGSQD